MMSLGDVSRVLISVSARLVAAGWAVFLWDVVATPPLKMLSVNYSHGW